MSKAEVLAKMYNNLPFVGDITKPLPYSKYIEIAKDRELRNYKLCLTSDLMKMGILNSFTKYQREFFVSAGATVAIFNTLNGKPVSVVFRAITKKEFMDMSITYCAYGFDLMSDNFKYGDWLLITEGIYDADSIRVVHQNSIALLTSNTTIVQAGILKSLTNRFIIAFDNDSAGSSGYEKTLRRLDGCVMRKLVLYGTDKDLGVMSEHGLKSEHYETRRKYYTEAISDIIENY